MHTSSVRTSARFTAILLSAAGLTLSAPFADAVPPQMAPIPLLWKPSGVVKMSVAPDSWLPSRIVVTNLRDARPHPDLIGVNHEDPHHLLTVNTTDSVPTWCKDRLNELFAAAPKGNGPEILLSGEVEHLLVQEDNDYVGNVVLKLTARTRSGTVVWSGDLRGDISHFGRTYKAYNYDESVSDALTAAASQLTRDPAFVSGLKRANR